MQKNIRQIMLDALAASHNAAASQDIGTIYQKQGYSGDISTQADLDIEKATIDSLEASGISAQIISEEKGRITINTTTTPKHLITIDPLDGSNNFAHARTLMPYATTIAIFNTTKSPLFKNIICAATIEHTTNSIWLAEQGKGATLDSAPCTPSKQTTIDQKGKYIVDFFYETNWTIFKKLIQNRQKININNYGSAAFHYALLSSGHIDAVMNRSQKAHELGAAYLLAEESGAIITDLDGKPLDNTAYDFNKKYPVVGASTKQLHKEILTTIKE